nr:class I SAM-dependent methyltransferase [uncultured Prevotella sp.]
MNQATIDFIRQHQEDDVRLLAFLGSKYPEVDMPFALDQIRGRKMARTKLPRWAGIEDIIYPPHISMEQCSSETTAMYKAELAARLLNIQSRKTPNPENEENSKICEFPTESAVGSKFAKNEGTCDFHEEIDFVDLTGGFGVDFSYIAARLGVKAMYVERQAHLCEAAKENFERLGVENAEVKNGDGVEVLHSLSHLSLLFIDPARRDDAGNKVVSLQDCTPDVTQLQDEMLEKADFIIIKLSPMLDWHRAVSELKHVREVHIVSTGNECKELLLVLSSKSEENASLKVYCVNDNQVMSYLEDDDSVVSIASDASSIAYLYEPNASLMKAGCFGVISSQYGAKMLAKNSHLFVSQEPISDFPGRSFRIKAVSSFNKKELKRHLSGITKANIATRNFPLSVAELRKRLKLKDGGETYIFATTLSDESHVLVITEKA